ncbi:hypothetical protein CV102_08555 [Natronococcus pandeyae]|uniref:Uncharacterized protein n=1 Tax=Natronococcus pandeyae TaxID=2055836 RepID=A0A8J8Q2V9_9EURY|nr:hypothetical protein CV102_08555 [Natronococcus pandeyae]
MAGRQGATIRDRERIAKALAIGFAGAILIAVGFVAVFDDLFLGASSRLTFGVVIAALVANRWEERANENS